MKSYIYFVLVFGALLACDCQRNAPVTLSLNNFKQIARMLWKSPPGRTPVVDDIYIRHYTTNFSSPKLYQIGVIKELLDDPNFNLKKPTVFYVHGNCPGKCDRKVTNCPYNYVELPTDPSIATIVNAYLKRGGYNILFLDWANLAFGKYLNAARGVPAIGRAVGNAILTLLKGGLSLEGLHVIGHSLGSHVAAAITRHMLARGYQVLRLTGLDPAGPGFYPHLLPIVAPAMNASDANFVDVIHTDGGGNGAASVVGHADFWPNGGQAKQPGCTSPTIFFSDADFCSHWRSWQYWAESVTGGEFLARTCRSYDAFLKGECNNENSVYMGLRSTPNLRGNYYLRTAAAPPFALGERGAS